MKWLTFGHPQLLEIPRKKKKKNKKKKKKKKKKEKKKKDEMLSELMFFQGQRLEDNIPCVAIIVHLCVL
ncbi:hypothetical protein llap_22980 [Limosa lapponica baueri]|uniref:Uncharacterized protein n=1 Tax=Limosa lapponica baueri TaxID=1758121 RepID=A0A2I0SYS9_LIMLA|nr:hypothetical protein llap_22980 [Limosa lapponica baueri]